MTDLYQNIANNTVGRLVLKKAHLPIPAKLTRLSEQLTPPRNNSTSNSPRTYLPNSIALYNFPHQGDELTKNIFELIQTQSPNTQLLWPYNTIPTAIRQSHIFTTLKFSTLHSFFQINQTIKAILVDTRSFKSLTDLNKMYLDLNKCVGKLEDEGRILLISNTSTTKQNTPIEAAVQSSLIGFIKSLGKELGRKGSTVNLLQLENQAHAASIQLCLEYFLSSKACYVSGQTLEIHSAKKLNKPAKIHKPYQKQTVLITGACGSIGQKVAETLSQRGATVLLVDLPSNNTPLKRLAQKTKGIALTVDLTKPNATGLIAETIQQELGQLNILIHSAGITKDRLFKNMPPTQWTEVIHVNLTAPITITDTLLSKNLIAKSGRVILISSIVGLSGNAGQTQYSASKAGLIGYMQALKTSTQKKQITINTIAPGFITSPMVKNIPAITREAAKRSNAFAQPGLPEDVAEAAALFAHPNAKGLNGRVLRVCGLAYI